VPGVSFWLAPATPPVQLGVVAPPDIGAWQTAKTTALAVVTDIGNQTATAAIPSGTLHVRLDFELVATAGGQTATVLSFKQLFIATSIALPGQQESGTLLPLQFTREDAVLAPSPKGPVKVKGGSATGFKVDLGLHPLLSFGTPGRISVNAEFVDVTDLWWKVHPDPTWGWYLHPDVKGRQEHLRVLAWTGGGNPMIWFAVIPDASVPLSAPQANAEGGGAAPQSGQKDQPATPTTVADIVFFRPPPGSNAFPYSPTQSGFEDKQHDDVTMVNLARYLLSPLPAMRALALKAGGLRSAELLADQVQRVPPPVHPRASDTVRPSDPMWLMKLTEGPADARRVRPEAFTDGRANAFRPVGLEAALNRSGGSHVLFLPLGFTASEKGNPQGGYEAVQQSNLKATLQSALSLLWTVNALGRDKPSPPQAAQRELWAAGHSEGNRPVWVTLKNNAKDIDRVVSFDSDTLAEGMAQLEAAGPRRPPNKPIHAFVIMTPNNGGANGLTETQDDNLRKLRKNRVLVTVLPDFDKRADYWHITPPPIANPLFLHLLAQWNVPASGSSGGPSLTVLDVSAAMRGNWNWLFFHELAIFGGDLIQPPATGGAAAPPPFVRTFFEQALGPPNPRPAP